MTTDQGRAFGHIFQRGAIFWVRFRAHILHAGERVGLGRVIDAQDIVQEVAEDQIPVTLLSASEGRIGEIPEIGRASCRERV